MDTVMTSIQQKVLPEELSLPLALDIAQIKGELVPVEVQSASVVDEGLRMKAVSTAEQLANIPPSRYEEARGAVDSAGGRAAQIASHQSDMLKGKLGPLMKKGEDGGPVAEALLQLRDQVAVLDPSGVNFTPGWVAKVFRAIPFVGNPVARYFNRFETAQGAINSVIASLESGKKMLKNDNLILAADQRAWRENTRLLRAQIDYLKMVDEELERLLPGVEDSDHKAFLQEEILFPLRQRSQDLLQRLAVNQQGVLVSEVLIRNNRELIRGVDRGLFVTVDALNIAVAAAMALANQELVLDAVDALNTTTNTLIGGTAKRLRTQGVAIQNRASSTMLDASVLKQAFADIVGAIDDVSAYRRNALPQLAQTIIDLNQSAEQAERSIEKMEMGNRAGVADGLSFDIEPAELKAA